MLRILPVPLGTANTYIVNEGPASILIDAGFPRQGKKFFTALSKQGMDPSRIALVVITHVHYDHVGNLREIRDACRCPVAVPAGEADWLRRGTVVFPAGAHPVGRALIAAGRLLARVLPGFVRFDPVEADILVDGEFSLDPFGMAGRIVMTPGHTAGSLSVLLDDGNAFVGDLAFNVLPCGGGPIMPPFADDPAALKQSWAAIRRLGARIVWPGHGRPFSARRLRSRA